MLYPTYTWAMWDPTLEESLDVYPHQVVQNLPASDQKLKEIRVETTKDSELSTLIKTVQAGGLSARNDCPTNILAYWNLQHELSFEKGILLKGERLIIPKNMQAATLQQLHAAHLGIGKNETMTQNAGILARTQCRHQAVQICTKCQTCTNNMPSNSKELTMINHNIEMLPWQKVATNLFKWKSASFLVTVNYHSCFFKINELPTWPHPVQSSRNSRPILPDTAYRLS